MTAIATILANSRQYLMRYAGQTPEQLDAGAASVTDECLAARDILGLDPIEPHQDVATGLAEWDAMNLDEVTGEVLA